MTRPLIAITTDLAPHPRSGRAMASCAFAYAECVAAAGGTPMLLPPCVPCLHEHLTRCDAFVFTGGGDPRTEEFGTPTHPRAELMDPARQAYELALLRALQSRRPDAPVLGICLGMQLMSLVAGGTMDQHLPDTLATHARHKNAEHPVRAVDPAAERFLPRLAGIVLSNHRQAMTDAGVLRVLARSDDAVIEAVADPRRNFYLGVQWHPERTADAALGQGVFALLVERCRA